MDWDPSTFRRQRSYAATTGSWLSRFIDKEYEHGHEVSMPYDMMGGRKKKWWFGMWKRIIVRKRKKVSGDHSNGMTDRYYRCSPAYDPWSYKQNFDGGSARMEPENLTRSFSAQFANPSGFLQRVR